MSVVDKDKTVLDQPVDLERMERESLHDPQVHARNTTIRQLILNAAQKTLWSDETDYDAVDASTEEIIKFFYVKDSD